jgi:hypothetical protein
MAMDTSRATSARRAGRCQPCPRIRAPCHHRRRLRMRQGVRRSTRVRRTSRSASRTKPVTSTYGIATLLSWPYVFRQLLLFRGVSRPRVPPACPRRGHPPGTLPCVVANPWRGRPASTRNPRSRYRTTSGPPHGGPEVTTGGIEARSGVDAGRDRQDDHGEQG